MAVFHQAAHQGLSRKSRSTGYQYFQNGISFLDAIIRMIPAFLDVLVSIILSEKSMMPDRHVHQCPQDVIVIVNHPAVLVDEAVDIGHIHGLFQNR
jgi:hypothetical protein